MECEKPLDQISSKLDNKPAPTIQDWAFCKSFKSAKSDIPVLAKSPIIGPAIVANKPPAHKAGITCAIRRRVDVIDLKVISNVQNNGAKSKIKSMSFDVKEVILVLPNTFWISLPDKVITANPPQSAKNDVAALLFNK